VLDYVWILDGNLAVSSMPRAEDVGCLADVFDCVVVLAESFELDYELDLWSTYGVECIHCPIPDFRPPHLLTLYRIVKWIYDRICSGRSVLVHCVGGLGRSGTVDSAYLVYAEMFDWLGAIRFVRKRRSGAVETRGQVAVVEALDFMLKCLSKRAINAVIDVGSKYDFGRGIGHASKVTQLSLKLWYQLRDLLGLDITGASALTIASILHDVGVCFNEMNHHLWSYKVFLKNKDILLKYIDGEVLDVAGYLIYHHRRRTGDPMKDENIPANLRLYVVKLAAIIRFADGFDRSLSQVVDDVKCELLRDELIVNVYGIDYCEYDI